MSETLQITSKWEWSPAQLPGCRAWFDAEDSATVLITGPSNVSSWEDKSGQSNNALVTIGVAPTYDAAGYGIVFNGTSQFLTTDYTANPLSESLFIVGTPTGITDPQSYQFIGATGINGRGYAYRNDGASNIVGWQIGDSNGVFAPTPGASQRRLLTTGLYTSNTGGSTSLYGSNMSATQAFSFSGSATTTIGVGFLAGPNNFFEGSINEIILFNREVSNEEKQEVEGYLAYKWNLQLDLPEDHPYKINPPFQNTLLLPTVPSGPIVLQKAILSNEYSNRTNKITANTFTPLSLSNFGPPCLYWYDAQDSSTVILDENNFVLAWNDKSGNEYNLVKNYGDTTYNTDANNYKFISGQGVLNYIGTLDFQQMSFFIVYADRGPAFNQIKYTFGAIPSSNFNSEDSPAGFIFQSLNDSNGFPVVQETYFYAGLGVGNTIINSLEPNNTKLYEYSVDESESKFGDEVDVNSFVNGFSSNSLTDIATARSNGAQGLSLGGYYDSFGNASNTQVGDVYELIGVSSIVSDYTRQKIVSYFAWKYGQKPNIPQDNPYLVIPSRGTD